MTTSAALAWNAAAEWYRLWTVRSTWLFTLATVVGVLGLATVAGASFGGTADPGGSPWKVAAILGLLGMFGILILATVTATADHATRSIVPTLQWTPRRTILLAARTGVIVLTTTLLGLALMAGASLIIWLFAPQLQYFSTDGAETLAQAAFVYAAAALLSVGLGLATRNIAAALTSVFALMLVLPIVLQVIPSDWAVRIIEFLPGSGAFFFLLGEGLGDTQMTTASASTALVAWSLVALVVGGWRLLHADADKS